MIDIDTGVSIIMNRWLSVKSNEVVHFVTDEHHIKELEAVIRWASGSDIPLKTTILPSNLIQNGEIIEKMLSSFIYDDVIIGASDNSFITTNAVQEAVKNGARFLSLPLSCADGSSLIERDFINMDIKTAAKMGNKITEALNKCSKIHITTKLGTDLTIYKENRHAMIFNGQCKKGSIASASFEVYVAPNEGKAFGHVVLDGAVGYIGKINKPVHMDVVAGKLCNIEENEDGQKFINFVENFNDKTMYSIGELGIGLNQLSKCTGDCYIEDESAYSTFHLGIGRNISLGGQQQAKGHYDIIICEPTIYAGDVMIMKDGKCVI